MPTTTVPLEQITSSVECIRNKNVNASCGLPGSNHDGKGKHKFVERVGSAYLGARCLISKLLLTIEKHTYMLL